MSLELATLIILVTLFVATNVFWSMLTLKLVNKIMSRSYYEYVQAQELKTQKPVSVSQPEQYIDPGDERQAQDMNSLVGIV